MGVFNTIIVDCPSCGEPVEFQTKSGTCALSYFHISDVSEKEIEGIMGRTNYCTNCKIKVKIKDPRCKTKNFSHLVETQEGE